MEKTADTLHEEVTLQAPYGNASANGAGNKLAADADQEHHLTIRDIWKSHKALMGWSFFWAMCAIGWGFDAQVNGAMISGEKLCSNVT